MRRAGLPLSALGAILLLYLLLLPVPIEPLAWQAPANPGYTGAHAPNQRLAAIELLPLDGHHGPEDVAIDASGRLYAATGEGVIVRLARDGSGIEEWADTGGRPLGIEFDEHGNLIVADAYRGLLEIAADGTISELATSAGGIPIGYANDVDVADDGRIFFSDASTKFGAREWGGTYAASLLDIIEHGGHGRLLMYEPASGRARTLLDGINFANGVAVSHDQRSVWVAETGSYRIIRYWLTGANAGEAEYIAGPLPAFPDNLTAGMDERVWVALVSPRNALLDRLSEAPFLRKVIQRLPAALRPKAVAYGHVIALDPHGEVVEDLQDPAGGYPIITSVLETEEHLFFGSLVASGIGRLPKAAAGL